MWGNMYLLFYVTLSPTSFGSDRGVIRDTKHTGTYIHTYNCTITPDRVACETVCTHDTAVSKITCVQRWYICRYKLFMMKNFKYLAFQHYGTRILHNHEWSSSVDAGTHIQIRSSSYIYKNILRQMVVVNRVVTFIL